MTDMERLVQSFLRNLEAKSMSVEMKLIFTNSTTATALFSSAGNYFDFSPRATQFCNLLSNG